MLTSEAAQFTVDWKPIRIPIPERAPAVVPGLRNSGYREYPDHLRGGWPSSPSILIEHIGVASVTSLVSLPEEIKAAKKMHRYYDVHDVDHHISVVGDSATHVQAAKDYLVTAGSNPSYLHCRDGSNRTGVVAVLANLYSYSCQNDQPAGEEVLAHELTEALAFGFDFDKPLRLATMQETLSIAAKEGWLKL